MTYVLAMLMLQRDPRSGRCGSSTAAARGSVLNQAVMRAETLSNHLLYLMQVRQVSAMPKHTFFMMLQERVCTYCLSTQ